MCFVDYPLDRLALVEETYQIVLSDQTSLLCSLIHLTRCYTECVNPHVILEEKNGYNLLDLVDLNINIVSLHVSDEKF